MRRIIGFGRSSSLIHHRARSAILRNYDLHSTVKSAHSQHHITSKIEDKWTLVSIDPTLHIGTGSDNVLLKDDRRTHIMDTEREVAGLVVVVVLTETRPPPLKCDGPGRDVNRSGRRRHVSLIISCRP